MDYQEFEGRTTDEAIVQAMKAFRTSFEELDIKILSEGSKGIFGIGSKNAKILARVASAEEETAAEPAPKAEQPRAAKPAKPAAPAPQAAAPEAPALSAEELQEREGVLDDAREVLTELLEKMGLPAEIKTHDNQVLEIIGDGSGLLIGKRGQTLDSLQFLVNRIINQKREKPVYVTLDTESYRERHVAHLEAIAEKMGEKAIRTGHAVYLDKMNPHDRRIIHLALKNDSRVNTRSIGDGAYKKIVIAPKKGSK